MAKYWSRRFCNTFRNKGIVLLYHRVVNLETDPQLLATTPENFTSHMKYISENYNVISLKEMVKSARDKKLSDNSVAITFDDGYADNFINAKPILEKYNIPATIFVTSSMVNQQKEFWWDDLERLILLPSNLPSSININGLGELLDFSSTAAKMKSYTALHVYAKTKPSYSEFEKIFTELYEKTKLPQEARPTHLPLSYNQLVQLESSGLIDIGAHTEHHLPLSMLLYQEQLLEIVQSKELLEKLLGHEVSTFSYPFGTKSDYTSATINILKGNGFNAACSNFGRTITNGTNPYELPRFLVRNWNADEFADKVKAWFHE